MEETLVDEQFWERANAISRKKFPDQPEGFPFENFDINEIKLPKGEDFGIPSDEELTDVDSTIEEDSGFQSVIIVDNIPVVPPEKVDKLTNVIRKIFGGVGTICEGGFYMPIDEETQKTKGFCIIEFEKAEEAIAARNQGHNYKLDKNHIFYVSMFDDFERYKKIPEEYEAPIINPYEEKDNLFDFMVDKRGRDQFVLRYQEETEVYWNDGKRMQAVQIYQRSNMTDGYVQWSPFGTYLATAHRQGIAIWGGPNFKRIQKFNHMGVRLFQFSPNERFLVTYSLVKNKDGGPHVVLRVFDTRNGNNLRTFQGSPEEFTIGKDDQPPTPADLKWPIFKWAGGKENLYFAKIGKLKNQQPLISVYSTTDMTLLDKKSLKFEHVQSFDWSPTDSYLCIYQKEAENLPARITLIKIPERTELRQKNLFNVKDVDWFWQDKGDYLAVKVDRHTKNKKNIYSAFEFFRVRDKDVPIEVMELPEKTDKILFFAWEPNGHRFAILHGEGPKFFVSFYSMFGEKGKKGITHIGMIKDKMANHLFWSPKGKNIVLAGLAPINGQLEFFSVDEFETMNHSEHFMMTHVLWDPSGRYVTTCVTAMSIAENSFQIWSFQGRSLYKMSKDRLLQFDWRPRLPPLLPKEREKEIIENLEKYSKIYEAEDEEILMAADTEIMEKRNRLINAWKSWYETKQQWIESLEKFRREKCGARYEETFEIREVELKQIVEVKEEIYKDDNIY